MLDTMKKKKGLLPKVMLWTLLGLGTIGLTFFGIVNEQLFGSGGTAADVNRDRITQAEVSRALEQQRQTAGKMNTAQERAMKDQILESMIQRKLIVQEAATIPLLISPQEVLDQISGYEAFLEDGQFSPTKYREILRLNQINARAFEQSLREGAVIQKVNLAFQMALKPFSLAQEKQSSLRNLKINAEYIEIAPESAQARHFTAEEVASFLADPARKTQVEDLYHQRLSDRYSQPEQVRARQILLPRDLETENPKELAEKVYELAKTEAFEKLVAEHSIDEFTKSRGGDLGFFARGAHEPEFDTIVFNTPAGEVTGPIATDQGFHIVKVEERRAASVRPLEEVQGELAQELLREEYIRRLVDLMKESIQAEDWQAVASLVTDHRLSWKETGLFDLTQTMIPGVGSSDTFMRAAFELKEPGEMSKQTIRVGEKTFFVRLKERRFEESNEMEGFAQQFESFLAQQQAQTVLGSWVQSVRERAKVRKYDTDI